MSEKKTEDAYSEALNGIRKGLESGKLTIVPEWMGDRIVSYSVVRMDGTIEPRYRTVSIGKKKPQ